MVPRAKVNYKRDPITAISDLINLFWLSTSNNKGLFGKKEKKEKKEEGGRSKVFFFFFLSCRLNGTAAGEAGGDESRWRLRELFLMTR